MTDLSEVRSRAWRTRRNKYGQKGHGGSYSRARATELELAKAKQRIGELEAILNTPLLDQFAEAVVNEARHQRLRWGDEHDQAKTQADWFWTLGYLGGKALYAVLACDFDKAKHHTITAAALLANWHRAIEASSRLNGADGRQKD